VLRVVAVDPWEPALTLARQNLAQSGVAERVELRSQRVEQFEEATTFIVAWLPGPFIAGEIADRALGRVYCAPVAGGWLVFGFNLPPHGRLEEVLASLRIGEAVAIRGRPGRLRRSSRSTVSSKSKGTRPRRQFCLTLQPDPVCGRATASVI